jgi:hypothetical protein
MTSPAAERSALANAFASTQLLSSPLGGLNRLAELVKAQPAAFKEWAAHPITRVILDAFHPLALNPNSVGMRADTLIAQYGVSQGLMLAYQLCVDPAGVLNIETPEAERNRTDLLNMAPEYLTPPAGMELSPEELKQYGIAPPQAAAQNEVQPAT